MRKFHLSWAGYLFRTSKNICRGLAQPWRGLVAAHSWYVLYAEGKHLELQPYDDRETAFATAFALLREARHVIEVGPVRGPMEAIVEGTELRRMMAELVEPPQI
jgi:hypothetical protein